MRKVRINPVSFLILLWALLFANNVYGDSCTVSGMADFCGSAGDTAGGEYKITFKKIEMSKDGSNFIVMGENAGGQQIDIGAKGVNSDFETFISNESVTAGTYTHMRVTISRTMHVKGVGSNGGTYYYTNTDNSFTTPEGDTMYVAAECAGWETDEPTAGCLAAATYDSIAFQMPSDAETHHGPNETIEFVNSDEDARITITLPTPITITGEPNQTVLMKFHTQSMLGFNAETIPVLGDVTLFYPMPPQQDVE